MIRTLAMIAVAGFLVSAVTLTAALVITGPDAVAHGAWSFGSNGWGPTHWRYQGPNFGHGWRSEDTGPQTTRDIAWNGGDSLTVEVAADVHYTQAPGPAKVTVNGPKGAVDDVEVVDGRIRYTDDRDHEARLTITVFAPSVTHFTMQGSGALALSGYHQDNLVLSLEGDADIKAAGEAKATELTISGSGAADLGALKTASAKVQIDGSGDTTLAPTEAAEVDISGSGDVTLLTNPPKLHTSISGSGRVRQSGHDISG